MEKQGIENLQVVAAGETQKLSANIIDSLCNEGLESIWPGQIDAISKLLPCIFGLMVL